MVLGCPSRRMPLEDLVRLISGSDPELVATMEVGGMELGYTSLGFLYLWYLMFCIRWGFLLVWIIVNFVYRYFNDY
jgi:hypothetical protein